MGISTEGFLGKEFSKTEGHPFSQMALSGRKISIIATLLVGYFPFFIFYFFLLFLYTLYDITLPPCFCKLWNFF